MTSIAEDLADRGHRLHVVTSLPWYQHHRVEPGWDGQLVRHDDTPWGRITRVHPFPTDKRNIPARAVAFGGFTGLAALAGMIAAAGPTSCWPCRRRSPSGLAGWAVARTPPGAVRVQHPGRLPRRGRRARPAHRPRVIAAASLARAGHLPACRRGHGAVRRPGATTSAAKITGPGRRPATRPPRSGSSPTSSTPTGSARSDRENGYRREHGLEGKTVVMYAGNVGFSQSLDLVLAAAVALRRRPRRGVRDQRRRLGPTRARAAGPRASRTCGSSTCSPRRACPRCWPPPTSTWCRSSGAWPGRACRRSCTRSWRRAARSWPASTPAPRSPAPSSGRGRAVGRARRRRGLHQGASPPARPPTSRAMGTAGRPFVEPWASPAAVAGDAHDSTKRRPAAPMASARPGWSSSSTMAAVKAAASSGPTATPGPGSLHGPGHLGAGIHAGHDRAPRGQHRVELGRHARGGQSPLQRHHVDVRRGQYLGQASTWAACPRSRTLSSPRAAPRSRSARAAPPPLITKTTSDRSARRWRRPTAPGRAPGTARRCRRRSPPACRSGRWRPDRRCRPAPGRIQSVSMKFGMTRILAGSPGPSPVTAPEPSRSTILARRLSARSSDSTVTASARR